LNVELSKRGQRAVTRIDTRWRKHADHPELFFEEMLETVEHLETVSNPGTPCPTNRRPQLIDQRRQGIRDLFGHEVSVRIQTHTKPESARITSDLAQSTPLQ
jgi:hypothetical protein